MNTQLSYHIRTSTFTLHSNHLMPCCILWASCAKRFVTSSVVSTNLSVQLVRQVCCRPESELPDAESMQVSQQTSFILWIAVMSCAFCCCMAICCSKSEPPPPDPEGDAPGAMELRSNSVEVDPESPPC